MEGSWPVMFGGREIGSLRAHERGAMTVFEAEAADPGGVLRLSVYGGGREGYLGVMSPAGEGRVALRRSLSRAALRGFPERIEYAAPSGEAAPAPEPEPEEGEPLEPEEQESDGAVMEPASLTTEELEHMAVVKLRAVARQIGLTSMTRKEIRFAKKEELLAAITAFLAEQNN